MDADLRGAYSPPGRLYCNLGKFDSVKFGTLPLKPRGYCVPLRPPSATKQGPGAEKGRPSPLLCRFLT